MSFLFFTIYDINSQSNVPGCYQQVWSDEFSGNTLDLAKWSYQIGDWNGSNVQNCYKHNNVAVSNGKLQITSKNEATTCNGIAHDFTSGFVQTKNVISWTFGYFEARIKVPASNSTWPAFWMSPQNNVYGNWPQSGEIDIFEIKGHDMYTTYGNAHWGLSAGNKRQQKGPYLINDASTWHVYGVEWNLGELKFYLDGVHYHTINDFRQPNAGTHPQPFDIDFYLRLNMAVGGDYLEAPWNDANNGIAQLPAVMEVDWVRVYELNTNCTPNMTCEIIENGGFENNQTNWFLQSASGATGTLSTDNNGYTKINVTNAGTSDWHLALRQTGMLLENGKNYEVSFVAYADAARTANVIVSKANGTQYHYEGINLTDVASPFSFQFTMNATTDANSYFNIGVGSTNVDVYVENISIREVGCIDCPYNLGILNQNIPTNTYHVENQINTNSTIKTTENVSFKAFEIFLDQLFEVEQGAVFEAMIDPCNN